MNCLKNLENLYVCNSASFTQYTVTITQVQESVSDFNPESESESHKNEDSASLHP